MGAWGPTCVYRGLLTATLAGSGGEERDWLSNQRALLPQAACGIPEGLELGRHVAIPACSPINCKYAWCIPGLNKVYQSNLS